MSKLFIPFPDIEKPDFYRGTGLGLSICKGIIDHHNGEIWALQKTGEGMKFCFSLPFQAT